MSGNVPTLYELCLKRTARLLKSSYWNSELPLSSNPFIAFPPAVIDSLITHVTRYSISTPLKSSDLRLLLTTGRVTRFQLEDVKTEFQPRNVKVGAVDLQKILTDLSSSSKCLILVTINLNILKREKFPTVTDALNYLLAEAQNLKYVDSCIEFDLHVLYNATHLQKLMLRFRVKNRICDFLEFNGELRPHTSLKYIELLEDMINHISYSAVAVILQYCTELISINCDISKSLEHLHAEELKNGSLTRKYKIQNCHFGSYADYVWGVGVRIASLTCPHLQSVTISVYGSEDFSALSNCQTIVYLNIFFENAAIAYYALGMQSLLQTPEIGHNLKTLLVLDIEEVDFASIGMCCPNLEKLSVCYDLENNHGGFLPTPRTSFRKLKSLSLDNTRDGNVEAETLCGMLSNATNLTRLSIQFAENLTDDVLKAILAKDSLSMLKWVFAPGLSLHAVKKLASSLTALESFSLYDSPHLNINEIAAIFKGVNPRVSVQLVDMER